MKNNFDAVIILGHGQKKREIGEILKNRLDKAFEVFQENKEAKMILSGGKNYSKDFSEAEIMSKYLESRGVEKGKIILEDKSRDTIQNLRNSKVIIEQNNFRNIALVTSDFHLKRAEMIAKNLGLDVVGISAVTSKYKKLTFLVSEFFKTIHNFFQK